MNERRIARLAAWFAVSNLGHMHNMNQERAGDTRYKWPRDPYSAVCDLAGHLMESDSHERIFGEEADGWYQQLKHLSLEEIREQYAFKKDCVWFNGIIDAPEEELEKMTGL